jgi:hypothetical protein
MEKSTDVYIKAKGLTTTLLNKIENLEYTKEDLEDVVETLEKLISPKENLNFQKDTLKYLITGWWIHQNLKVEH